MRVLVTDGHYKNALAIVRSLGRRGVEVVVGSPVRWAQAACSKFCSERVVYPHCRNEEAFVASLVEITKQHRIDVVLPVGYGTCTALSKHADRIRDHARLLVASAEAMRVAADKRRVVALAREVGVPTPRTFETPEAIDSFPVVVKGVTDSGRVRYVNAREELARLEAPGFIIQEYIPGEGCGFFALCKGGEPKAVFMHRRLREFPVTGGASTAAESIRDPKVAQYGKRLLRALKWDGVAMVEFKRDARDGEPKLMEINPKFWGSLDLSIAAGVDFPWLAVKMATEGDVEPREDYTENVRFHWPLPDEVLHVLSRPTAIGAVLRDCLDRNTGSNLWLGDIKPNLLQLWLTVRTVAGRLLRRQLFRPHGAPRMGR